jgi:ABC-type uncharacterized transport system substrate-binding protein
LLIAVFVGASEFGTSPKANNGKPWCIAYYEGGQDENYYFYLNATIMGLIDLGWIDVKEIPRQEENSTELLWRWLCKNASGKYIKFLDDGFYSAKWDQNTREALKSQVIKRQQEKKDIDLILAMGTWAGKDLSNDHHSTPTMIMSTSNPVAAGIIKSVHDSGRDHIHARVDPGRYSRQVRLFHDIIGFKKLGVAYEDSLYGRTYAAIDLIEEVSKQCGFEVVRCYTKSDITDLSIAGDSVINCFDEMAKTVDAIYVTTQGGINETTIPKLVKIANEHRIPTFYQTGSEGVKKGFLLSISRDGGFKPVGRFLAATLAKILNGAKPRELKQIFEESPDIAINLKTAEIIGLYLYADVLAAADEIYLEIESSE